MFLIIASGHEIFDDELFRRFTSLHSILGGHINLFDFHNFSIQEKNKKFSIRGQTFGIGAFETEDEDTYNREDMSRYDFALGPEHKSKSISSTCITQRFIHCK